MSTLTKTVKYFFFFLWDYNRNPMNTIKMLSTYKDVMLEHLPDKFLQLLKPSLVLFFWGCRQLKEQQKKENHLMEEKKKKKQEEKTDATQKKVSENLLSVRGLIVLVLCFKHAVRDYKLVSHISRPSSLPAIWRFYPSVYSPEVNEMSVLCDH